MKHFKCLIALIVPLLLLSSCKKSSDTPPAKAAGMSFKVNGTLVKTDSQIAETQNSEKAMVITGLYNNRNSSVQLYLPSDDAKTYDVVKDHLILDWYDTQNSFGTYYTAQSGSVTITSVSATTISGTFQFKASSTAGVEAEITEGQFTIPMTDQFN
jgi:hypothetical protein